MDFFIGTVNTGIDLAIPLQNILLPLGISFFTFQQISYVVECYRGNIKNRDFLSYALFVSFFPQLIAGPIVRFQEIVPQFLSDQFGKLNWSKILIGLIIFTIGLSKKIFLADNMAGHATPIFDKANADMALSFSESWFASLAYSFQIYFDFSAYSDMAIGIALMLGLSLPVNFLSPYKAKNIIEFWRTWHMTLSRFLRDYLYFPLGGNRDGKMKRYRNLMLVMLIGGLWHGASWNFVIWGGLHGLYLMINHTVYRLPKSLSLPYSKSSVLSVFITFICVTFAWVFFRAETLDSAFLMTHAMVTPTGAEIVDMMTAVPYLLFTFLPCIIIVWFMPNAAEIQKRFEARLNRGCEKNMIIPSVLSSLALSCCVFFIFAGIYSEFIYFQF